MPQKDKEARKEYNRQQYLKRKQSGKEEKIENITLTIQETSNNDHLKDEINELKYRIEMLKEQLREKDLEIEEKDEIIKSQEQDILDQTEIIEQLENEAKRNNKIIKEEPTPSNNSYYEMIIKDKQIEMLEQQNEFLLKQNEILQNIVSNSGNSNTIPKSKPVFNLEKYLNEDCKDAMDIKTFVQQKFIPTFDDLVYFDKDSWQVGMKNMLEKVFSKINKTDLPIQVTDSKRKHYYYKYENKWINSEDDENSCKTIVGYIGNKLIKMFQKYKSENKVSRGESAEGNRQDKLSIKLYETIAGAEDSVFNFILTKCEIKKH